jgi:hypothetical protein
MNTINHSGRNYIHTNNTGGNYTIADHLSTDASMHIDGKLEVQGRDVLKELDEMREALLLLKRDVDLEEKYPELKQAYDDYMELYRGLHIAEKFYQTGNENE